MRNELQSSLNGNCLPDDTKIISHTRVINNSIKTSDLIRTIHEDHDEELDVVNVLADYGPQRLTEYAIDSVIYIAGFVERHIKKEVKCSQCLTCLSTPNIVYGTLTIIKNQGHLIYPQQKIYKICKIAEQEYRGAYMKNKNFFLEVAHKIIRSVYQSHIFCDFNRSYTGLLDHKLLIIKAVVEHFLKIRCFHIAKQFTLAKTEKFVRKKLTKLIHFNNQ